MVEGCEVGAIVDGDEDGAEADGLDDGCTGDTEGEYVQRHCTGGLMPLHVRGLMLLLHTEPGWIVWQYMSKQSAVGVRVGPPAGSAVGVVSGLALGELVGAHTHPIGGTRSVQEFGRTCRSHREPRNWLSQYLS